jgi:hypothetical protein
MSVDHAIRHGIIGRPTQVVERCPRTGRIYEVGSGAWSKEEQTERFLREAAIAANMPREGEHCLQTGREYMVGSGAWPRSLQTQLFPEEAPPEFKALRRAKFEAFRDIEPQGRA